VSGPVGPFDIGVRQGLDRTVVSPRGEIDIATIGALREALQAHSRSGRKTLVIDLRDVCFMDVLGAHLLLETRQRCGDERLTILNPSDAIRRLLELTGISAVLGVR